MTPTFTYTRLGPGPDGLEVKKLIPEVIGKEIEKQCKGIFPLKDCMIRKVKIMKKPKFDITKPLGEDGKYPMAKLSWGTLPKMASKGKLLINPFGNLSKFGVRRFQTRPCRPCDQILSVF